MEKDIPNYLNPTWTKYMVTLGPPSGSAEMLEGLAKAGANMFRSNFAHCKYDEYRERRKIIQEINQRLGTKVEMSADLQGPNIRLGEFENGGVEIAAGQEYTFYTAGEGEHQEGDLFINDATLHLDVQPGEPITFMDGALEGTITKVEGIRITASMTNGGFLKSRKSINVPETNLSSPCITEKDRQDIDFLLEAGTEYIALSFIKGREEVDEVRRLIGDRPIKIIVKIERREAIKNIFEIVDATDAVMIARGDLGIELPMEEIPIIQRELIAICAAARKPVITATQMLLSMARSLRPTRAEVSDVANAVFARSDAIMLSEETADGIDPVNALNTMVRIAQRAEAYILDRPNYF